MKIDQNKREKRAKIQAFIGIGVIVIMLGVAVLLGQMINDVRGEIAGQYVKLDQSLSNIAFYEELEEEIGERSDDVDRIKLLVIHRDEIGKVVSELEKEAKKYRVELRVPSVEEEVKLNEDGDVVPVTVPWKEVRLSLVVIGLPYDLLSFLHAIEYEPYLMAVVDWRLEVQAPAMARSIAALMPSRVVSGSPDGQDAVVKSVSSMKIDLVLTTLDNKTVIELEDS